MAENDSTDLLKLAFELVAERGWHGFSLMELARRAGVPLATVYAVLPSEAALLRTLGRRLDAETFALPMDELDRMSPRERVFELIMRRLDAMAPFKPGLERLSREGRGRPELIAAACCNLRRLSRRLLDVAGGEDRPLAACLGRRVLGAVYARAFSVWLRDDTPDMARTLAELDKRLQQAETVEGWYRSLARFRPGRPAAEESPA